MSWSKRFLIYVSCPVLIIDNINLVLICSRLLNFYEYIVIAEINKSQKIPRLLIMSAMLFWKSSLHQQKKKYWVDNRLKYFKSVCFLWSYFSHNLINLNSHEFSIAKNNYGWDWSWMYSSVTTKATKYCLSFNKMNDHELSFLECRGKNE